MQKLGWKGGSSQGWAGKPRLTFGLCSYPVIPDSRPFPVGSGGRRTGGYKWCPTSYFSRLAKSTRSPLELDGKRAFSIFLKGSHVDGVNTWFQFRAPELSSGCAIYLHMASDKLVPSLSLSFILFIYLFI